MKFLKGLVLSLLSLLLFLSLSVFGLALTLNNTILNPDFFVSELNKLDVYSLAKEQIKEQIGQQIPEGGEYLGKVLEDTIADLEPWVKEQVSAGVYSVYDYLLGRSQSLSLVISTEPVMDSLKDNLREAILQSPPPELKGLPPAMIEQYFDEFYGQLTEQVPPTFELDESLLGTEIPAKIAEALAEAEGGLEKVRHGIGYFQLGYKALIGFILLLILGIILINHEVRGASRSLGTTFLAYGAIEYGGIFAAKYFATTQLPLPEIPQPLQAWLPQLLGDLLAPLEIFSLGLLAGGVALLIVSFVYKPR